MQLPVARKTIAHAYDAPAEGVPLTEAAGRISAEFVMAYPPGIPLIAPGEEWDEALVRQVLSLCDAGRLPQGLTAGGDAPPPERILAKVLKAGAGML